MNIEALARRFAGQHGLETDAERDLVLLLERVAHKAGQVVRPKFRLELAKKYNSRNPA